MQIINVKVAELRIPERNIRIHTEKQLEEFVRSIKMFGQIRPVVIDENNTILAGNGMIQALKKTGIETASAYRIEGLSEQQKKKLMIVDNKIYSLGIDNLDTLNSFLEELQDDLDIPGFDEDILKSMVAQADEISETLSTYGTLDEKEIEAIKANKDKKEQNIEKAASVHHELKDVTEQNEDNATSATPPPETPIRKFVICPKCGEEIWL